VKKFYIRVKIKKLRKRQGVSVDSPPMQMPNQKEKKEGERDCDRRSNSIESRPSVQYCYPAAPSVRPILSP
jgi:hypothetical protein